MPRSITARRSAIHGRGVFALHDLPADHCVLVYHGTLLTHEQADALYAGGVETGHTFLFTLNDHYVIDGNQGGDIGRWINHSCNPNCEAVLVEDADGNPRRDQIEIHTLRDIGKGEELSYDYGISLDVRHTTRLKRIWACHCGAPDCTGTLLQPKRSRKKK